MRKYIFVLSFLFSGIFIYAQELHYGVKGGLNVSTMLGDVDGTKARTSFHAGAVLEISLNDKFSIQPEVLFSAQGVKEKYSEYAYGYTLKSDSKLKMNYLNIPIMAKYYVIEGLSIEAGPQIGILLSAKADADQKVYYNGTIEEAISLSEVNVKDSFKGIDLGLNFGIGYKLDFGLAFNARYNLGLTNINDDFIDGKIRNGVFQFSAGYFFN